MNPNKKLQEKIFTKFLNFFHEAVKTIEKNTQNMLLQILKLQTLTT